MYGTPNEKLWPGITKLPDFKQTFPQFKPKGLTSYCNLLDDNGMDLLSKMIVYDPCKRISAKNALNHVRIFSFIYLFSFSLILMILIKIYWSLIKLTEFKLRNIYNYMTKLCLLSFFIWPLNLLKIFKIFKLIIIVVIYYIY